MYSISAFGHIVNTSTSVSGLYYFSKEFPGMAGYGYRIDPNFIFLWVSQSTNRWCRSTCLFTQLYFRLPTFMSNLNNAHQVQVHYLQTHVHSLTHGRSYISLTTLINLFQNVHKIFTCSSSIEMFVLSKTCPKITTKSSRLIRVWIDWLFYCLPS